MAIISHSRKFIFIKTVKTAGTSLEMALSKYCAADDVLTPLEPGEEHQRREIAGIGAQNYLRPASALPLRKRLKRLVRRRRDYLYGEHSPAWALRRDVGEEVWNSYFKFAVVRNPFDRCVSRYFYTRKYFEDAKSFELWDRRSFDQFLRYHPEMINENWAMYTEKDHILLDYMVRYEDLKAGLAEISRRIGLDHNLHDDMRHIRAKGDYRPGLSQPGEILNETQKLLISILCRKEMETFGYEADRTGARPKIASPG